MKKIKILKARKLFLRACPDQNFEYKPGYVRSACTRLKERSHPGKYFIVQ